MYEKKHRVIDENDVKMMQLFHQIKARLTNSIVVFISPLLFIITVYCKTVISFIFNIQEPYALMPSHKD